MSRFVDRDQDPIFRNSLRILIQQLEQSSWVLCAATQCYSGGHGPQDLDALVTAAKHVISSVQSILEGLDGTNHPDILSLLQDRVQGFDMAKREPYFILPSLQDGTVPELKQRREPGLGKSDPVSFYPSRDNIFCPSILDTSPQSGGCLLPAISNPILDIETREGPQLSPSCRNGMELWMQLKRLWLARDHWGQRG